MPHAPDLSGCALDDRYELHAVIGEGAFGRVYEGLDRRLERAVAVKVIKPWWADDPEWVATFERETRLLARVSDPGIVQIYDVGHAPEGLYYVSELVDGESLASRLRRGPLAAWEACGVAAQLCRALAGAHAQRIVHRDVKPANSLLSSDGRVKVGDFGVARLAEGSTDGTAASIVGTPRYMAPEQGRGRPTTPATDVYSAGVVLYEMLAGHPPFTANSVVELALLHLQEEPPPLSVRLPTSLVAIVDRALAKEPAHRFADGAEMAEALLDARRQSSSGRRARVTPSRTRTSSHEPKRGLVGAGASGPRTPARALWSGSSGQSSGSSAQSSAPDQPPSMAPTRVSPTGPPLPPPPAGPHGTRRAPRMSPRRNINPAGRRRAAAALGVVIALLAGMVTAAVVIGRTAHTHVPTFTRLSQGRARAVARRAHVRIHLDHSYATSRPGTVIAQHPDAGTEVPDGTTVRLTVSKGPAPVPVVSMKGQAVGDAEQSLRHLGLRTTTQNVPAPGTQPGTVVGQDPAGGTRPRGSTVTLFVAEVPRWRPVTTFSGASSGPIHIRGQHWRIVYRMAFTGTCTWVLFCSGPSARITDATGRYVAGFGLNDGDGQVQSFNTGPGTYTVQVTPGGDDAGWSLEVQDNY
ncbi:MAG: protein kinase domain-containing protein [Solirubrobacteraceae bacterium]